jgi:glycogen synthase
MLSWEFPPHVVGGLGKHVADLAPALAAQDIELHIVTPGLRDGLLQEAVCDGVTVHRVPPIATDDPAQNIVHFSQTNNRYLERAGIELAERLGGFDLIHGHDWLVAYSSVALKYALKTPLLMTLHSMERGRMQGHLASEQSVAINGTEWWLTYEADHVITVSHYMAGQIRDHFNVPPSKISVIYNGVDLPATPPLDEETRSQFRAAYAPPDERIVYYVGRIVHEKGVQVLVDAAPLILRQQPNTRFVIAGTGAYLEAVRAKVRSRAIDDRFVFAGFVPDDVRDRLYEVADVAVFPSLYEPFGIVALEAMAQGCPVVVSNTGGLAEFVRPHENGILVAPGDPESLAWGVLHVLQYPAWAAARAANARRDVETLYNWQHIAAQTVATYRQVRELHAHV